MFFTPQGFTVVDCSPSVRRGLRGGRIEGEKERWREGRRERWRER